MPTKTDTPQDAATEPETAEVDATTNSEVKGGKRPRPIYAAEKVTEIPEDLKLTRNGPRPDPAFIEALQVAQADPGEAYCVATYQSQNGAKTALKAIQKGEKKVPSGEWDFEARRIEAPGSTVDEPVRWSKLFATFLG